MASKYDTYWLKRMEDIRAGIAHAIETGAMYSIDVKDISKLGNRKSWYGVVRVTKTGIERGDTAHARSLGRLVREHIMGEMPDKEVILKITNRLELEIHVRGHDRKSPTHITIKDESMHLYERGYIILNELEKEMRDFIDSRLTSAYGNEWWDKADLKPLAESWRKKKEWEIKRTKEDKGQRLISYCEFSDYKRIIKSDTAWNALKDCFERKGWILQKLEELEPIRNAIMHHNVIDEKDIMRLELYSDDIIKVIARAREQINAHR